ncbi:hypothetical protein ACG7TL_009028 [Trametes sanguinea]
MQRVLRTPGAGDFERFSAYARRIKTIHVCGSRHSLLSQQTYVITQGIWDFLHQFAPKPLLPSLREIVYTEPGAPEERRSFRLDRPPQWYLSHLCKIEEHLQTCDPSFEPCLGSRLKHVAIRMAKEGIDSRASIRLLASHSHNVETLDLRYSGYATLGGFELGAFLNLSHFTVQKGLYISQEVLYSLGTLPRLKVLNVGVAGTSRPEEWHWDAIRLERPTGLFHSLERLAVVASEMGSWSIPFLETITSPSLNSITLQYKSGVRVYTICQEICATIASLPSRDRITYLSLSTANERVQDDELLGPATIAPLLRLPCLQYLRFETNLKMIVDDALLENMSCAWPHIRTLLLSWPKSPSSTPDSDYSADGYRPPSPNAPECPRASLPGLMPLIAGCSHLTELGLAIDTRRRQRRLLEILECPPPELRSRSSPLRTLTLIGSVLASESSLDTVAMFFSLAFCSLRYVHSAWPRVWWQMIMARATELNQIRAEEMRYKARNRRSLAAKPTNSEASSIREE